MLSGLMIWALKLCNNLTFMDLVPLFTVGMQFLFIWTQVNV